MPYHRRYFSPLIDGGASKAEAGELDITQLRVLRTASSSRVSGNSNHPGLRRAMGRRFPLGLAVGLCFPFVGSGFALATTTLGTSASAPSQWQKAPSRLYIRA